MRWCGPGKIDKSLPDSARENISLNTAPCIAIWISHNCFRNQSIAPLAAQLAFRSAVFRPLTIDSIGSSAQWESFTGMPAAEWIVMINGAQVSAVFLSLGRCYCRTARQQQLVLHSGLINWLAEHNNRLPFTSDSKLDNRLDFDFDFESQLVTSCHSQNDEIWLESVSARGLLLFSLWFRSFLLLHWLPRFLSVPSATSACHSLSPSWLSQSCYVFLASRRFELIERFSQSHRITWCMHFRQKTIAHRLRGFGTRNNHLYCLAAGMKQSILMRSNRSTTTMMRWLKGLLSRATILISAVSSFFQYHFRTRS